MRRIQLLLAGVLLAAVAGCSNSTPLPPIIAESPGVTPAEQDVRSATVERVPESTPTVIAPAISEDSLPPSSPPLTTERLLLLSPTGPLVVEFEIWIDGRPQGQVFEQLLDEVLQLADTDGDGLPTWKEVTTSPRFKYGQFGNLPFDRENAPKQLIQQYDVNGNGRVDRAELPRFLTRNAGGSRAFSVRSVELYPRNRIGSPTWRALDRDEDGVLSRAELQSAFTQLRVYDVDDDEILLMNELGPRSDVESMSAERSLGRIGDFARLLGPHAHWDSVRATLEEEYAGGRYLKPSSFRLMGEVFEQLDADQNGQLSKQEFPAFNEIAPHLRFRIDFGAAPQPISSFRLISSRLTKEQTGGESPQVIEHPGRIVLCWPGVQLTFVQNDTIANVDYEAQAQQVVAMYDADANGYLEESEVNEPVQLQFARFEALDTDSDQRVYPGEIAAFLRQRQGVLRAQVHCRVQDREDTLFAALDQNADGRLDARELETAVDRLQALDTDQDGEVTSDELPVGLAIVLARGSIENANQLFAVGPVEVRPATNLPPWFVAMDTSGDGVISAREFLGSAELFATLDRNQNGYFEPEEIPADIANAESAKGTVFGDTSGEGTLP
jgi:Ca2+-binding EF-hand superfamily protein